MVNLREKQPPKKGIYTNYKKAKGKPAAYMAVALLVILIMAIVLNPNRSTKRMEPKSGTETTSSEPVFQKQGVLTLLKSDSTEVVTIDIEIADDDMRRERGLMYRRQMELGQGMLFIFEEEDFRSFWMRNTYLPLDILYLDASRKILDIHENTAILNDQPIPSSAPAKYVLEVNAGFCALYNIRVGDRMTFRRK